jgi:hypothetical protein
MNYINNNKLIKFEWPIIEFTYFTSLTSPIGFRYAMTFPEFCDFVERYSIIAKRKDDLPLIKLATFKDNHRCDLNLEKVYGIEGDYDGEEISVEEKVEFFRARGIPAFFYTTPSYTREKPRWRVLIPFSEAFDPSLRKPYAKELNEVYFNSILAPETYKDAQAYHIGGVEGYCKPKFWRCYE